MLAQATFLTLRERHVCRLASEPSAAERETPVVSSKG